MAKFPWAVQASGFQRSGTSGKLAISESEDKMAEAIMLLKQARHSGNPGINVEAIDEVLVDLSTTIDKVRKMLTEL